MESRKVERCIFHHSGQGCIFRLATTPTDIKCNKYKKYNLNEKEIDILRTFEKLGAKYLNVVNVCDSPYLVELEFFIDNKDLTECSLGSYLARNELFKSLSNEEKTFSKTFSIDEILEECEE